jgi:predicted MFS family arabinose efflux permease
MSFFSSALPVLMRQGAYSLLAIALLKLIKIPWLIKFLWSPIVDSRTESLKDYKQWIFGAEVIYAIIIFIVATLSIEADFTLIIILIILAFISSATQDIATDAMAARSFDRKDTSLLNSIQSMGSFTGSMVGGGFLLLLFHKFGWNSLLPWVAIFVLMALIPLFFIKKIKLRERKVKQKAKPKDMLLFFNQKNIWRQVVFLLLYYAGLIGILSNLSPFLVDIGYDIKEIGGIVGIFGVSFGILCAFISGIYIRKIGKSLSRKIISFLIIVPAVYFIWLSSSGSTDLIFILIGVALVWGIYGMSSTLINTSAMDIVRDGREGTDFTLQIVITHLGAMIITIVSASIGDAFGYKGLFLMQLVIALISFLYVLLFKPYSVKYETMN